ncbi:hypothetical protein GFY24_11365 [Nocardia sp. SYP-A9097]|uniref:hypothetical protein n=1 Tax=Nocardia sp. SYP-A9097 TaxID=2663237 RepID=UPI00129B592E|nr:hypothetical protein [Nocardia sp. SYP-A9097]MRH88037.1 hypothetical protein [Nocardia sp. SYP-A9097]
MKTLVGTTGAIAIALFIAAAPSASAEGIPLQDIGTVTEGGINTGSGNGGGGDSGSAAGFGSVQIGNGGSSAAGTGSGQINTGSGNSGSGYSPIAGPSTTGSAAPTGGTASAG